MLLFVLFCLLFMLFCYLLFVFFCCLLFVLFCCFLFVLFYVLFVCKCLLYYCHRVATELQFTNISYYFNGLGDSQNTAIAILVQEQQ
jgi:hypothetical protein